MVTKVKTRAPRKETLAVASQVKNYVRTRGYNAASELPEAVSTKIAQILDAAIARTEGNGRRTVRGCDL